MLTQNSPSHNFHLLILICLNISQVHGKRPLPSSVWKPFPCSQWVTYIWSPSPAHSSWIGRAWFLNSPSSWLVTLLRKGSQWRYGAHGQRHYSKCGTRSILQRGISFPKPGVYITCNGRVLNDISFISCGYITLWIPLKFMIFAVTSTFPVYIYRSVSPPPPISMYNFTFIPTKFPPSSGGR